MTSNKAPQSTQPAQVTYVSQQPEKVAESLVCERCRADNTLQQRSSIVALRQSFITKAKICIRYKMKQESFDVLIAIGERWLGGKPSTVFSLSIRPDRGDITALHYKVDRLIAKGLVEHLGFGHMGCKTYAPTRLGMAVIDELFPV